MKNDFIFNARDLHESHFSKTEYKFWVMKYLNGLEENKDFVIDYVKAHKNGKARITHFLTYKSMSIIKIKLQTPFSIYGYKCPIAGEIKYVGCSINEYLRFSQIYNDEGNKKKRDWAISLRYLNLKPEIVILDVASTEKEAGIKEQEQIKIHAETIFNSKSLSIYKSRFNTIFHKKIKDILSSTLTQN